MDYGATKKEVTQRARSSLRLSLCSAAIATPHLPPPLPSLAHSTQALSSGVARTSPVRLSYCVYLMLTLRCEWVVLGSCW